LPIVGDLEIGQRLVGSLFAERAEVGIDLNGDLIKSSFFDPVYGVECTVKITLIGHRQGVILCAARVASLGMGGMGRTG